MGDARAQALLGIIYQDGDGVRADDREAVKWFSLASTQGHRASQYALALNYEFGQGVPRNRNTAISLLNAAASQGEGRAGWLAGWLKSSHTPAFHNERELGTYIILEIEKAMAISDGGGGNPLDCGPVIGRLQCAQQLEQARIRKSNQDAGIKNSIP